MRISGLGKTVALIWSRMILGAARGVQVVIRGVFGSKWALETERYWCLDIYFRSHGISP